MTVRTKNAIYTLVLLLVVFLVWKFRTNDLEEPVTRVIPGKTMGTTYRIIVFNNQIDGVKEEIDSLLLNFNQSLSTYITDSEISRLNQTDTVLVASHWFHHVLRESKKLSESTHGAFDPTVGPLVNFWGFGPDQRQSADSVKVDSLLAFVGMEWVDTRGASIVKSKSGTQLDFSAVAKGYAVDEVSRLLLSKGFSNHFVEIGGEVRTSGMNTETGNPWRVGITDPRSTSGEITLFGRLEISDVSMATSGNYFNYYESNGRIFSHTINPETGWPIRQRILSATVVAEHCLTADALATSFMVMGHEKAITYIQEHDGIEGVILYAGDSGDLKAFVSKGLSDRYKKIE